MLGRYPDITGLRDADAEACGQPGTFLVITSGPVGFEGCHEGFHHFNGTLGIGTREQKGEFLSAISERHVRFPVQRFG